MADRLGGDLHVGHEALGHGGRVRARHGDLDGAVRGHAARAGRGGRRRCRAARDSRRRCSRTCCRRSGRSSSSTRRSTRWRRSPGCRHDHHFADEAEPADLGHLVRDLVDEGKAVAAAAGVDLYEDPWEMNVHATRGLRPLSIDAGGRRSTQGDRDRPHHRLTRPRGGAAWRPGAAAHGAVSPRQGEGGVVDERTCQPSQRSRRSDDTRRTAAFAASLAALAAVAAVAAATASAAHARRS